MMIHGWLLMAGVLAGTQPVPIAAPASSITVEVTGHGRPMLLIPGFVSAGGVWKDVVDHYKGRFECHVVTIAGFAGVAPVQPASLARVRDDLIAYVKAKKLDHAILVGHSMGGVLALWIAARAPDLPSAVVSVDGVPFLPALMNPSATADSTRAQAGQMKALYESMTPQQLGAQSRLAFGAMISDGTKVDAATKWAESSDPTSAAAFMNDLFTTDIRGEMSHVTAPVLLIPAVKAMAGSPEVLKAALGAYEAQVASIATHELAPAQTLHFVMLDDPQFLVKTMDGFLAKHANRTH